MNKSYIHGAIEITINQGQVSSSWLQAFELPEGITEDDSAVLIELMRIEPVDSVRGSSVVIELSCNGESSYWNSDSINSDSPPNRMVIGTNDQPVPFGRFIGNGLWIRLSGQSAHPINRTFRVTIVASLPSNK